MNRHIVVLGGGSAGTLAANRLHCYCSGPGVSVLVVDRADTRDPEAALLTSLGLYGPHTLRPPEHLHLRDGIGFRHTEVATVDTDRAEVCLGDGTTLPYDVLVVATGAPAPAGYVTRSPGLGDEHGLVPVDPATRRCPAHARVYAIGAAADGQRVAGQVLHSQAERLARAVRGYLAGDPPLPRRTTEAGAGGT
ncbi:FAD-dependent oxidoreductase [Streptomyces sp. HPF1205]|uniref:FAD-dependent oxidoreductase n=1 Tax=Streptomyces sp. HPF1205 TaxID=2873262 RepID=UPI001CEC4C8F|nr:FAD-dependent oxidoreductase [Streptomyces sp. HPF1205]